MNYDTLLRSWQADPEDTSLYLAAQRAACRERRLKFKRFSCVQPLSRDKECVGLLRVSGGKEIEYTIGFNCIVIGHESFSTGLGSKLVHYVYSPTYGLGYFCFTPALRSPEFMFAKPGDWINLCSNQMTTHNGHTWYRHAYHKIGEPEGVKMVVMPTADCMKAHFEEVVISRYNSRHNLSEKEG